MHHRSAMHTQVDVALILWNQDVIDWVSLVLLERKLRSHGVEPSAELQTIEHLIGSCRPYVVVFDIAPPYTQSTAVLLRLLNRFPDRAFVVTCADPVLAVLAAPWLSVRVVLQTPYEPDVIVRTVVSMASRAPQRSSGNEAPPQAETAPMTVDYCEDSCCSFW
jgi:hypothetical protein